MFLKFFGMPEHPFGVTPDPRFLYLSEAHREALASLYYGIEANRGFLGLIAKPGMGKTTLLFHLLEKFRTAAHTAFIFQTQCNSREFLRLLLAELGHEDDTQDFVRLHEEFNHRLLQEARAGKRMIVVIDEAQNLAPEVLETVRLLSDFETPRSKLMHIILSGQPQLADKLASPSLMQLRQRVSIFQGLEALTVPEVRNYIEHRLRVAGYTGEPLFAPEVYRTIADFTEGIPRNVNNFCFNALSLACALQKKVVDNDIAKEVISDLDISRLASCTQPHVPTIQLTLPAYPVADTGKYEARKPNDDSRFSSPTSDHAVSAGGTRETLGTSLTVTTEVLPDVRLADTSPGNGGNGFEEVNSKCQPVIAQPFPSFSQRSEQQRSDRGRIVGRLQNGPSPAPVLQREASTGLMRVRTQILAAVVAGAALIAVGGFRLADHSGLMQRNAKSSGEQIVSSMNPRATLMVPQIIAGWRTDVVPGTVIEQVLPNVPRSTRKMIRSKVRVSIRATVTSTGEISSTMLDPPRQSRYLSRLAMAAIRHWKFRPAQVEGQPVSSQWTVRFQFGRTTTQVATAETAP
jgi:general secretion pathway protein A